VDYFGAYIPDHLRLTQPPECRRHAGPADKAMLEEMRQRAEIEPNEPQHHEEKSVPQKPAPPDPPAPVEHCTIITVIAWQSGWDTLHCLTHGRTFRGGGSTSSCPAAREMRGVAQ
jgi:hypothetical protein